MAAGLELGNLKVLTNPNHSMILCFYTVPYTAEIGFPESEFWISYGENADKNKKGRKHSSSTIPC